MLDPWMFDTILLWLSHSMWTTLLASPVTIWGPMTNGPSSIALWRAISSSNIYLYVAPTVTKPIEDKCEHFAAIQVSNCWGQEDVFKKLPFTICNSPAYILTQIDGNFLIKVKTFWVSVSWKYFHIFCRTSMQALEIVLGALDTGLLLPTASCSLSDIDLFWPNEALL